MVLHHTEELGEEFGLRSHLGLHEDFWQHEIVGLLTGGTSTQQGTMP